MDGDRPSDRELFDDLVDRPAAEREAALRARCGEDLAQRVRVARLLEAADASVIAEGFLGPGHLHALGEGRDLDGAVADLPRRFGAFTLERVLGRGGMGIVYAASQEHPRRRVALKVMRSEMVSHELLRRFRREIDTLARLQHPGIAQILEAGSVVDPATGATVPFIAMEFVEGPPLDDYVRGGRLAPRRIVELLVAVCDAVQHAHARGVVHRDLKPANILVVERDGAGPQPMVLDFGIARLVGAPAGADATLATSTGQILGTLAYMSPEQIGGRTTGIDGRSDVYTLGVVLYELLAGRLPLDVRDRSLADAARMVRDDEPTRLGLLHAACRGDLETIVAKAIEKDPDRRYPEVQSFADDLRRWLADEPIRARPATRVERLRRFARRHRALVWGTSTTIVALVVGIALAIVFAFRAGQEREMAEWTAYRASMTAAVSAIEINDVRTARLQLELAPTRFRDWEWRYAAWRLDRSLASIPLTGTRGEARSIGAGDPAVWCLLAEAAAPLPAAWPTEAALATRRRPPPAEGARFVGLDGLGTTELWWLDAGALVVRLRDADGRERWTKRVTVEGESIQVFESAAVSPDRSAATIVFERPDRSRVAWHRAIDGGPVSMLEVRTQRFSPAVCDMADATHVALSGGPEALPCIWTVHPGETPSSSSSSARPLVGHLGEVRTLHWDPDGRRVATGGMDRTVRIYAADGTPIDVERQHRDAVWSVHFSHDGSRLVSASQDGTVRLWSVPHDRAGLLLDATLLGHDGPVGAVDFSADDRWVVSASGDGTLRVWSTDLASLTGDIAVPDNSSGRVDIARRTGRVAGINTWGVPRIWDDDAGGIRTVAERPQPTERYSLGSDIAISPDGESVVVIEQATPTLYRIDDQGLTPSWSGGQVKNAAFTEDGQAIVLTRGEGDRIVLSRLDGGSVLLPPYPRFDSPALRTTPDGRRLVVDWGRDGKQVLVVMDPKDGAVVTELRLGVGTGWDVGRLPDGRCVVVALEADPDPEPVRAITVRDAEDGRVIRRVEGLPAHAFALVLHPDGRRLFTAGRDRVVRVWDTATWDPVVTLPGPGSYIWSMRLSEDGTTLAMGCGDRVFRIWQAPPPAATTRP